MTAIAVDRSRPRLARVAPALLSTLLLTACAVTLVAGYDEAFDRSAAALQVRMDSALTALSERDVPADQGSYAATEGFYRTYGVDLRALVLRARSLPKNEHTATQVSAILASLEELRSFHQQQTRLSPTYALRTRDEFNQSWQNVLALELAKRR